MLPGVDGREICRVVRSGSRVPIIMLTARTTEQDRIDGLDLGADDYVTKPFSPRELVARVRANLRRSRMEGSAFGAPLRRGELRIDPGAREVTVGGRRVELTRTEFDILLALASRPGQVWSRERLNDESFTEPATRGDRTIDAHIKNLRRKIEPDRRRPRYIRTVFGVGYKFLVPDRDEPESS